MSSPGGSAAGAAGAGPWPRGHSLRGPGRGSQGAPACAEARTPLEDGVPPPRPRAAAARVGEVAEWLKAHAWNACIRATVSRVRIPLSPPVHLKSLSRIDLSALSPARLPTSCRFGLSLGEVRKASCGVPVRRRGRWLVGPGGSPTSGRHPVGPLSWGRSIPFVRLPRGSGAGSRRRGSGRGSASAATCSRDRERSRRPRTAGRLSSAGRRDLPLRGRMRHPRARWRGPSRDGPDAAARCRPVALWSRGRQDDTCSAVSRWRPRRTVRAKGSPDPRGSAQAGEAQRDRL